MTYEFIPGVLQTIFFGLHVLGTRIGLDSVIQKVILLFFQSMGWKSVGRNETVDERLLSVVSSRSGDQCKTLISIRRKSLYSST